MIQYTSTQMDRFHQFLSETFGPNSGGVIHQKVSNGLHIDLVVLEPNDHRDFWIISTMGVGALKPITPSTRIEFFLCLPKEWPVSMIAFQDEENYWPFRLLLDISQYLVSSESWIFPKQTYGKNPLYYYTEKFCGATFLETWKNGHVISTDTVKGFITMYAVYPLMYNELLDLDMLDQHLNQILYPEDMIIDINRKSLF